MPKTQAFRKQHNKQWLSQVVGAMLTVGVPYRLFEKGPIRIDEKPCASVGLATTGSFGGPSVESVGMRMPRNQSSLLSSGGNAFGAGAPGGDMGKFKAQEQK